MRAHIIENGVIVNTIEVSDLNALPGVDLKDASVGGGIGDNWAEGGPKSVARSRTREELKAERQVKVDAITVTVNGKVFDGDEVSQGRMVRAITVANFTNQASAVWVLHDNTAAEVTKEELAQALALSIQAQAALWVIPK